MKKWFKSVAFVETKSKTIWGTMIKKFLLIIALCSTIGFNQAPKSEEKSNEAKDALAVVNNLFEAMRTKNADAIRAAFYPDGQLTATQRRDGRPNIRVYTGDSFSKLIVETKGQLIERMYKPETLITGDLALVRGRYGFFVDDRFSHCGLNSFHLMRTADGWKIVNAASTIEMEGCEPEAREKR